MSNISLSYGISSIHMCSQLIIVELERRGRYQNSLVNTLTLSGLIMFNLYFYFCFNYLLYQDLHIHEYVYVHLCVCVCVYFLHTLLFLRNGEIAGVSFIVASSLLHSYRLMCLLSLILKLKVFKIIEKEQKQNKTKQKKN